MEPRSPKLLEDIRDAGSFILDVTASRTLDEYLGDRLVRQAVERNFEIVGEALSRLGKADPVTSSAIADVRRIVAFRNVLVHGYDTLDHEIVWHVIRNDLPRLLESVQALLDPSRRD